MLFYYANSYDSDYVIVGIVDKNHEGLSIIKSFPAHEVVESKVEDFDPENEEVTNFLDKMVKRFSNPFLQIDVAKPPDGTGRFEILYTISQETENN